VSAHPIRFPFTSRRTGRDEATGILWRYVWIECPECKGSGEVEVPGTDSGWSSCFADCEHGQIQVIEPDWTDAATGGACLHLLGSEVTVQTSPREGGLMYRIRFWRDGQQHALPGKDSLGEACAAVAVALGRWPGP
jgi:hypothetical protein